jgi:ribulose-bisphosphate carboxylase large chain
MLGSYTISPNEGIAHGILFSTLMRLAGADITIFPNFGGRFSFSQAECLEIRDAAIAPLGEIAPTWISPGGGMSIERISEMIDFYGKDTALLIGGALHRGSLRENAQRMAEAVSQY